MACWCNLEVSQLALAFRGKKVTWLGNTKSAKLNVIGSISNREGERRANNKRMRISLRYFVSIFWLRDNSSNVLSEFGTWEFFGVYTAKITKSRVFNSFSLA